MKKVILIALCLVLGSVILTGCFGGDEPFEQKNYVVDAAQIRGVSIDVRDRQIEVSLSDDGQIHLDYFENSTEYYSIFASDDGVLNMTSASNKEWTEYFGGKPDDENRKISLRLPDMLLDSLALSTTNEDISVYALTAADNISFSANGGDISFERLDVGSTLDINAKNGDISGTVIGSYDDYSIVSKVKKGESNLPENKSGGTKTLNVSANNGDIDIELVKE